MSLPLGQIVKGDALEVMRGWDRTAHRDAGQMDLLREGV